MRRKRSSPNRVKTERRVHSFAARWGSGRGAALNASCVVAFGAVDAAVDGDLPAHLEMFCHRLAEPTLLNPHKRAKREPQVSLTQDESRWQSHRRIQPAFMFMKLNAEPGIVTSAKVT